MCVRNGSSTSRTSLRMNVGTGSSEHHFVEDAMMILRTSSSDTSWNPVSDELARSVSSGLAFPLGLAGCFDGADGPFSFLSRRSNGRQWFSQHRWLPLLIRYFSFPTAVLLVPELLMFLTDRFNPLQPVHHIFRSPISVFKSSTVFTDAFAFGGEPW